MNLKLVYFPNLNSLRFIAASMVIIHHIEQIKDVFGMDSYYFNPAFHQAGKSGVVLFFVLSGFLITSLLLRESKISNTINIKNFYMRRILRIWPLYFLVMALAFFICPKISVFNILGSNISQLHVNFSWKLLLFVFLLPNFEYNLFGPIPLAAHLWSIGVEEQFYLIWPIGMKKLSNKFLFMMSVIIFYIAMKFGLHIFIGNKIVFALSRCWDNSQIDCMAVGGMFSFICYSDKIVFVRIKNFLFGKYIQYIVSSIIILLVLKGYTFGAFQFEVYSLLFAIIICNMALNENRIINLEISWLSYMGKISYGLYMYHPFAIVFSINIINELGLNNNYLLYILSMGFSMLLASISYDFFEAPFIKRKTKFSTIISGDEAADKKYYNGSA